MVAQLKSEPHLAELSKRLALELGPEHEPHVLALVDICQEYIDEVFATCHGRKSDTPVPASPRKQTRFPSPSLTVAPSLADTISTAQTPRSSWSGSLPPVLSPGLQQVPFDFPGARRGFEVPASMWDARQTRNVPRQPRGPSAGDVESVRVVNGMMPHNLPYPETSVFDEAPLGWPAHAPDGTSVMYTLPSSEFDPGRVASSKGQVEVVSDDAGGRVIERPLGR